MPNNNIIKKVLSASPNKFSKKLSLANPKSELNTAKLNSKKYLTQPVIGKNDNKLDLSLAVSNTLSALPNTIHKVLVNKQIKTQSVNSQNFELSKTGLDQLWLDKNIGFGLGQMNLTVSVSNVRNSILASELSKDKNKIDTKKKSVVSDLNFIQDIQFLTSDLTQLFLTDSKKDFVKSDDNKNFYSSLLVFKRLQSAHPQNYSNILGYRTKNIVVNPNITLQGIRRVLHYFQNVLETNQQGNKKPELIIVMESSLLNSLSQQYITALSKSEQNTFEKKRLGGSSKSGAADLLAYSLLRLQQMHSDNFVIKLKTAKETISYLATKHKGLAQQVSSKHSEVPEVFGVLMINPAKSVLGTLAERIFTKKDKKLSTVNAIGVLCAKKGIPLISLCDVVSSVNLCTYPIICDTRNVKNLYLVFDLLTYGLNKLSYSQA